MKKVLESTAKIRFQDCDPFNHLNNSKYLDYFINAREDQVLDHYNIDIFKMIRTEYKGWVVMSNQIAYFKPAITMENIVIESQVISFNNKQLKIELRMYNHNKTELKSFAWTNFVHFDLKTQKSTNHSEQLMLLFTNVNNPIGSVNFEERMQNIK